MYFFYLRVARGKLYVGIALHSWTKRSSSVYLTLISGLVRWESSCCGAPFRWPSFLVTQTLCDTKNITVVPSSKHIIT